MAYALWLFLGKIKNCKNKFGKPVTKDDWRQLYSYRAKNNEFYQKRIAILPFATQIFV